MLTAALLVGVVVDAGTEMSLEVTVPAVHVNDAARVPARTALLEVEIALVGLIDVIILL